MLKTFTLERIVDEQFTETEGKRTFFLVDEKGEKRTVWGSTLLDEKQQPVSITAQRKREHPLLQCLFESKIKDTINIEFTQYNAIFDRKANQINAQTVEEIAEEMQKKSFRVGPLIKTIGLPS